MMRQATPPWGAQRKDPVLQITVVLGNGDRRAFEIASGHATVGRRADCDVVIDDPSVSRVHAEIVRTGDGWEIRDLDSLNGIEVEGRMVRSATLVERTPVGIGDARLFLGEAPHDDSTIIIRRERPPAGLWLDADHRCLRDGPRQIGDRLAPREYALLKLLADAGGHVVERRAIEEALWGRDAYDDNALHQLVRRTRERIGDDGPSPRALLTLPGAGYRLDLNARLD